MDDKGIGTRLLQSQIYHDFLLSPILALVQDRQSDFLDGHSSSSQ